MESMFHARGVYVVVNTQTVGCPFSTVMSDTTAVSGIGAYEVSVFVNCQTVTAPSIVVVNGTWVTMVIPIGVLPASDDVALASGEDGNVVLIDVVKPLVGGEPGALAVGELPAQ